MANEGIVDGGDLLLYVEVSSAWTMIGEAKSHSLSLKSDVRVRRTKSTGLFPGRKITGLDATASTDCLVTYGDYGYWELVALQLAKTHVKLKLAGHKVEKMGVVEAEGDKYLEGTFVIDSIDLNSPNEDDASFTASFSIDGSVGPLEVKTVSTTP